MIFKKNNLENKKNNYKLRRNDPLSILIAIVAIGSLALGYYYHIKLGCEHDSSEKLIKNLVPENIDTYLADQARDWYVHDLPLVDERTSYRLNQVCAEQLFVNRFRDLTLPSRYLIKKALENFPVSQRKKMMDKFLRDLTNRILSECGPYMRLDPRDLSGRTFIPNTLFTLDFDPVAAAV
jgi:hypothetical protein